MAGDWIKMRVALHEDPRVIAIAERTGLDVFAVVGRLHRLWSYADSHTADGNAPGVTGSYVDATLVKHAGFFAALKTVDWARTTERGIRIPRFEKHNGRTAKARAGAADRVQRFRNAHGVTKALPEKRREEKRRVNNKKGRDTAAGGRIDLSLIPPDRSRK